MAINLFAIAVHADTFRYNFSSVPLSEALTRIAEDHKEISLNFIYNELDNYKSTAEIKTDNAYEALRQTIGINPVSIVNKNNSFFIEALQHGRFKFSGKVIGADNEPLVAATVMLLSGRDSTVVTYGITDSNGDFTIPCDRKQVIAKISYMGYKTTFLTCDKFNLGTIILQPRPITLSDVKIHTTDTQLAADKNTFIPSSRQKKSSQNAIDLLSRMAIPQLIIAPGANSVQDLFGNTISIFINGHKADNADLQGMKMTDVRKVEFIEAPSDPRFLGEEKIINFIVKEYEYGGYTKVSIAETILNGFSNNLSVFSKFTFRKFTFDLFAGSINNNHHHNGNDTKARYILDDVNGTKIIDRTETCVESHKREDEYPLSFRLSYNSKCFTARNTISYTHNSTPHNDMSGRLDFGQLTTENYKYQRLAPSRYNSILYYGNYWGIIDKSVSLDINPSFNYTHRSNTSLYSATKTRPINNKISEDAYKWSIQSSASKTIGQNHNILICLFAGQNINRLTYSDSDNNFNEFSNLYLGGLSRYRFQTSKYSLNAHVGVSYERTSMNGIINNDTYPHGGIRGTITFNRKNQLSASLYYQTTTPSISLRSNDIVQSNELMYITGNPNLHNVRNIVSNISYNFVYNNALSTAFFTGYENDIDRVAIVYRPYNQGNALLRDFINDGNYVNLYAGTALTGKLLDNSLQLYANITQNFYRTSGIYKTSLSPIRLQFQASYYWRSFNVVAYWVNRESKLTQNSNIIIRGRNSYGLSLGWGNGTWVINLSARNFLRHNWRTTTWHKDTPLYSEMQTYYNPSAHANLNLSVTYTIGYGKKIHHSNEIGGGDTAPSAILN